MKAVRFQVCTNLVTAQLQTTGGGIGGIGGLLGGAATATAAGGPGARTATATGGAAGDGGDGGTGGVSIFNAGNNYEDVENSAEIEQEIEQGNEDCQISVCTNAVVLQTQLTGGGIGGLLGGVGGSATATATGVTIIGSSAGTATATGGAGGDGGNGGTGGIEIANTGNNYEDVSNSAELEQVVEQENEGCEISVCTNAVVAQLQVTGGGAGGIGGLLGGAAVATATGAGAATATGGAEAMAVSVVLAVFT